MGKGRRPRAKRARKARRRMAEWQAWMRAHPVNGFVCRVEVVQYVPNGFSENEAPTKPEVPAAKEGASAEETEAERE